MAKKSNTKPATNRDINAAERAALAVKLRASKLSYDEIAKRCGYSDRGACYRAVQREMDRVVVENVEELRTEELATLDYLQQQVMPLIEDKDNKSRLFAIDRLMRIHEERAKLLGLYANGKPVDAPTVVRDIPEGI